MVRFFERLNTPWAVVAALAFFLVVDGLLFYGYQQHFERDNAMRAAVDAEPVAAERTIGSLEPGPGIPEEPDAPAEGQDHTPAEGQEEPAIEQEEAVLQEAGALPAEEEGGVAEAVRLAVSVSGAPSWLRVEEDRQVVFDQASEPGFAREFVADRAVRIQADNAGAVRVKVDGRDAGLLGAAGESTTRTYTAQNGTETSG